MPGGGGMGGGGGGGIGGMLGGGGGNMMKPPMQMPMGNKMPMPQMPMGQGGMLGGGMKSAIPSIGGGAGGMMPMGRPMPMPQGMPMGAPGGMPSQMPSIPQMGQPPMAGGMPPRPPMQLGGGQPPMGMPQGQGMMRPPQAGAPQMPQAGGAPKPNTFDAQAPDIIHKYLNTPEGTTLTKSFSPEMQSYIKPVASTSPQQAAQMAQQNAPKIAQQMQSSIPAAPPMNLQSSVPPAPQAGGGLLPQANAPQQGGLLSGLKSGLMDGLGKIIPSANAQGGLSSLIPGKGMGNPTGRTEGILGGSIVNPGFPPGKGPDIGQLGAKYSAPLTPPMAPGFSPPSQAQTPVSSIPSAPPLASAGAGTPRVSTQNPINTAVGDTMAKYDIGNLAGKYETPGGKGGDPGFISSGMGGRDPGGVSYGAYQLETNKGTMQGYLKSGDPYAKQLSGLKVNSPEFKSKWKDMASKDPEGFQQSQFDYISNKPGGYNAALAHAEKLGWDTKNPAIQSAIFSTSNQSGGWKNGIFDKAGIKPGDSPATQVNKLYDARANYFSKLNLDPTVKRNIIQNRTVDERQDALKMIGG